MGVTSSFLLRTVGERNLERKWQGGELGVWGKEALPSPLMPTKAGPRWRLTFWTEIRWRRDINTDYIILNMKPNLLL